MSTPKTTISSVIADLEAIRDTHGDLPCYTFYEYESGVSERATQVCLVDKPREYDSWQFPHVQIS